jgi:hypothetical protein
MLLANHHIDAIRLHLRAEVADGLEDGSLLDKPISDMTTDEWAQLHDAAQYGLMNAGPVVRSYTAQQDKGPYPVWIAGVEGVYVLLASEYDALGPFVTLSEAIDAMQRNYGEFLIGG